MPLRILLADDHEIVRRGLRVLLEARPGWRICGEAANGREAVEQAKKLSPDIVIMDITMPELNGLEASRRILQATPRTQVLILTMHDSEELVQAALESGARGYVVKSDPPKNLIAAVEALGDRSSFFSPRVSNVVLKGYMQGAKAEVKLEAHRAELSSRETEILQLLAEGHPTKGIAALLCISVKTVATHRANIMRKLNADSLSEVLRYAIRNKLIAP